MAGLLLYIRMVLRFGIRMMRFTVMMALLLSIQMALRFGARMASVNIRQETR
jgi:hypothetical protein